MSALDLAGGSGGGAGTGPGGGAGTGPTPSAPPKPTPTKSDMFDLALSLGEDVASIYSGRDGVTGECASRPVESPARRDPMDARSGLPSAVATSGGPVVSGRGGKGAVERAPRPVELPSGGGRAGGSSPAPGAVSGLASGGVIGRSDRVIVGEDGPPGFVTPNVRPELRFSSHRAAFPVLGDGPVRPGQPGPPPRPQPTGPVPHPPPPRAGRPLLSP